MSCNDIYGKNYLLLLLRLENSNIFSVAIFCSGSTSRHFFFHPTSENVHFNKSYILSTVIVDIKECWLWQSTKCTTSNILKCTVCNGGFYVGKSQRAAHTTILKKTFCSKMLKINRGDDFEQKVFLSAMRCALGFPDIKSSNCFSKFDFENKSFEN